MEQVTLFAISLVANAFSAFSGGGAGLIQLPALIFLGLPFGVALATHRIASEALGLGATVRHLREGRLERRFTINVLAWGLPGVVIGASVILEVPGRSAEIALGSLILGLGLYSALRRELGQVYRPSHRDRRGLLLGGLGVFGIGLLNGSLSAGTGLFLTLWLIRWYGFDYQRAVAHTLVLVGLFWNGIGALTLGLLGEVHWAWL
ncbi:MAG: sulfite exporter TauE/SafE family protein, partial [Gammaproteobacteria bacterium]